ncbi:thioredoxin domain-containing protein [Puia sp.]|jgi:uncharacterized membrane protein|uniref:thioredoxin domain-containing protein n=1 Tax=Puia sp. TaxID=2045100 RepID=UPI002F41FA88
MISEKKAPFEIWITTYDWLRACGNKISQNFCKEEITTHPDYPSLLSMIDFLDIGGFSYQAVQADLDAIHQFNYPLLAHIKKPGENYMKMIADPEEWANGETGYWSGIVVFPGEDARWKNAQNDVYRQEQRRNRILALAFIAIGSGLFTAAILRFFALTAGTAATIALPLFGLLSLSGIVFSMLSLGLELGFQNQLVKQVCGSVSKGGCEKVLKSKYAKGVAGITPADLSTTYFLTQFVFFLAGSWYPPLLMGTMSFAFGGIVVAALSVYTQASILKQWCAICLAIVAILTAQTALAFLIRPSFQDPLPETGFLGLFALFTLCLLPVKRLVKVNTANKFKLQELKRWKLDGGLFIDQWKQGRTIDASIWQNDLLLGDAEAPLQITVACNPYCGPCAREHARLDELLHNYKGKIKVQMRLLCNEDQESDKRTIATKAILERATAAKDSRQLQDMLTDWFTWMNYDKWSRKWQPQSANGQGTAATERMRQHMQWIKQSEIVATPTFFLNGRKMPGRYSLADIGILIPQLIELTS